MSMQPPPTAAERLAARRGRSASSTLQLTVLILGVAGAAVIAVVLSSVTERTNPIWVLPVIVSGFICFAGLLASTTWTMRSVINQASRPRVTGGTYLTALLLAGAAGAYASDAPAAAYVAPVAAAAALTVLRVFGALRRRKRLATIDDLRRGTHVAGTVTDDGLAEFADSPTVKLATVTVSFRDTNRVERWVFVSAVQSPNSPIVVGDKVDVWFDQSAPGDVSRIVVEHDNGVSRIAPGRVRAAQ